MFHDAAYYGGGEHPYRDELRVVASMWEGRAWENRALTRGGHFGDLEKAREAVEDAKRARELFGKPKLLAQYVNDRDPVVPQIRVAEPGFIQRRANEVYRSLDRSARASYR